VPAVPVRPVIDLLPALVIFYAGLVLLTRAWLQLRREVTDRPGTSTALVILVAAVWALPLVLGPPLASRDVYSYAAIGELADAGYNPYEVGPRALGDRPVLDVVDPLWKGTPTPYGPAFISLARGAVGTLGATVLSSVFLFRALALAGLGLVAWFLPRLARASGADAAVALVVALGNPLTLLHLVSGAHNEALMVGVLVAGLALGTVGLTPRAARPWGLALGLFPGDQRGSAGPGPAVYGGAIALCTVAAAIKAPALLGVVWLAWIRPGPSASVPARLRSSLHAGALSLLVLAAIASVTGYGWGWTATSGAAGSVTAYLAPTTILGWLADSAARATGLGWDGLQAGGAIRLLGIIAAAAIAVRLLSRSHVIGLEALVAAFTAVALLLPAVHPWYLAWGLLLVGAVANPRGLPWYLGLSVVMSFAVLPVGPDLGRQLLAEEPVWVLTAAVAGLIPLVLARGPRGNLPSPRRTHATPTAATSSPLRATSSSWAAATSTPAGPKPPSTAAVSPAAAAANPASTRSPEAHEIAAHGSSQIKYCGESSGAVTSSTDTAPTAATASDRSTSAPARPASALPQSAATPATSAPASSAFGPPDISPSR
jgi:alpha-1,6-mannosyltransferase